MTLFLDTPKSFGTLICVIYRTNIVIPHRPKELRALSNILRLANRKGKESWTRRFRLRGRMFHDNSATNSMYLHYNKYRKNRLSVHVTTSVYLFVVSKLEECVCGNRRKRLRSLTHRFWPITIHSYHYNLSMDRIVQCKESSFIHSHLPGNASSTLVRRLQMLSQTVGVACRLRNVTHVTPLFDVLLLLLLFMLLMFASLMFRRYGAPFAFTLGR